MVKRQNLLVEGTRSGETGLSVDAVSTGPTGHEYDELWGMLLTVGVLLWNIYRVNYHPTDYPQAMKNEREVVGNSQFDIDETENHLEH